MPNLEDEAMERLISTHQALLSSGVGILRREFSREELTVTNVAYAFGVGSNEQDTRLHCVAEVTEGPCSCYYYVFIGCTPPRVFFDLYPLTAGAFEERYKLLSETVTPFPLTDEQTSTFACQELERIYREGDKQIVINMLLALVTNKNFLEQTLSRITEVANIVTWLAFPFDEDIKGGCKKRKVVV